jgi:limonene-1,2-epoxide hydrolase
MNRTTFLGGKPINRMGFGAMQLSGPGVFGPPSDFTLPDKSFELPVMGTFEISDGKINAWRDYFDINQFTSRMG